MIDREAKLIMEAYDDVWAEMDQEAAERDKNIENYVNNPSFQVLTDKVHSALCHRNHTDGCSYKYGNWKKHVNETMKEWMEYTIALSKKYGEADLAQLADTILEGIKLKQQLNVDLEKAGF